MKKTFVKPTANITELQTAQLIMGSNIEVGGEIESGYIGMAPKQVEGPSIS